MLRRHNAGRIDAGHSSAGVITSSVLCGYSPVRLLLVDTVSPVFVVANAPVLREPELHPVEIQIPRGQDQKQGKNALR